MARLWGGMVVEWRDSVVEWWCQEPPTRLCGGMVVPGPTQEATPNPETQPQPQPYPNLPPQAAAALYPSLVFTFFVFFF